MLRGILGVYTIAHMPPYTSGVYRVIRRLYNRDNIVYLECLFGGSRSVVTYMNKGMITGDHIGIL